MLNNQSYLTNLDELYVKDLRDTTFSNDVKAEISELNSIVVTLKTER